MRLWTLNPVQSGLTRVDQGQNKERTVCLLVKGCKVSSNFVFHFYPSVLILRQTILVVHPHKKIKGKIINSQSIGQNSPRDSFQNRAVSVFRSLSTEEESAGPKSFKLFLPGLTRSSVCSSGSKSGLESGAGTPLTPGAKRPRWRWGGNCQRPAKPRARRSRRRRGLYPPPTPWDTGHEEERALSRDKDSDLQQ